MTLIIAILWIFTIIIAFSAGFLVYRNNAKKFKKLEEQAKTNPTVKAILEKLE